MERYRSVLYQLDNRGELGRFGPQMFEAQRFLNVELHDSRFRDHYRKAALRFATGPVRYVGDKVPHTKSIVLALTQRFPDARFVFIYRDLERVASSYCRRANDPNDAWPRAATCALAAEHWQEAFASGDALTAVVGEDRMFVVKFEQLFGGDHRVVEAMFAWLGVDYHIGAVTTFQRQIATGRDLASRPLALTAAERRFVSSAIDHRTLERYEARAGARIDSMDPSQEPSAEPHTPVHVSE
jgi:hypothetical protein